jgi:F-type H+-transporting ATPase subunit delta
MTSRAAGVRYARALFDVALRESDVRQVGRDLEDFARIVAGNEALSRVLSNPAVPAAQKRGIVDGLLAAAGTASPIVARLLRLLADRDRLVLLPHIVEAYRARLMEHEKVMRVEVITAMALPPDRVAALQQRLADASGRRSEDVHLETRVDPSIIGGAITKIGSRVYDGSVTRQLAKLRERLVATTT